MIGVSCARHARRLSTEEIYYRIMAFQPRSPAFHNQMLGRRTRENFANNTEEDFENSAAKRLKRFDSSRSSLLCDLSEDNTTRPQLASDTSRDISDSEAEIDLDGTFPRSSQRTDLESTLPQIKTDKEAIAGYEARRATGEGELGLRERLGQRNWTHGKSSIYVDAFNLTLETVLEDESHLFNEAEMAIFSHWNRLSYEAQYLYVRLFLRKTAAWHRMNKIDYGSDIRDISVAARYLCNSFDLPALPSIGHNNHTRDAPLSSEEWGTSFTFADRSEGCINTVEEASSLLRLDELKIIAKEAKIQGKNKSELLSALRRTSRSQYGLGWPGSKLPALDYSTEVEKFEKMEEKIPGAPEGAKANRNSHFLQKILDFTGSCIRLASAPLHLFERVHLVFYRSTEWTDKSLTTIILARVSKRNFPDYIVSRSANIFPSRSALLEFEASIRTQFQVDDALEMGGRPNNEGLQTVRDIFDKVYPTWKNIIKEEQYKEDHIYETGEGAYLRRFSPAWVYTRIVHKGAYVLGRFKEHKMEHKVLAELLHQRLFHVARRGAWYQRKALLEEHYMWTLESDKGRSEVEQKKHWKRVALQTCEEGLQDRNCHLIYHYNLQKRITKLEKSLRVAKRHQHDFGHVLLSKAVERTVEGIRIEREPGPSGKKRGGKTIWVDEREGGSECSVEAMSLSWYRDQGWKGYHSEGGIVRTLFGFLFYDVLFSYIPNVFQTPYQTCPLDLHTDAFYPSRASEINHRLMEIANGNGGRLLKEVYDREVEKKTCVVGIDWSYDIEDLLDIVRCFRGEALATVCKVMAQEYQERGGGIPDLFLWHPEKLDVMFSEVKSENDRLSDTQRLWIHVLTGAGINVELCNAVAKRVIIR